MTDAHSRMSHTLLLLCMLFKMCVSFLSLSECCVLQAPIPLRHHLGVSPCPCLHEPIWRAPQATWTWLANSWGTLGELHSIGAPGEARLRERLVRVQASELLFITDIHS